MQNHSNKQVTDRLRALLTDEAREMLGEDLLEPTREWRTALWEVYKEIDARMCPTPETYRKRNK